MAKRKGKGQYGLGSIREVRPGVYDIAAPRVNGQRPRRRINGTREDAVRALDTLKKSLAENDVQHLDRLNMAQVLDRFLRVPNRHEDTTRAWYASLTRNHINPVVGKVLLRDFRHDDAQKALNVAQRKGLAPKSIIGVRNVLRAAHTWALDYGYDGRRIAWKAHVRPPRAKGRSIDDVPTVDEVRRVLDHVRGTEHEAIVSVLIGGGLRRGELLALRWRDVDLRRGTITVEGSISRVYKDPLASPDGKKGGRTSVVRKRPKNEASESVVHLPAFALDALRRLPRGIGESLVFARKDGTELRPDGFTVWFRRLLEKCGVRAAVAVHTFGRHGCASLMAAQGATMKQVQVHLRHSTMSVTSDLYVHLFEGDQKDAAARLDALLNRLDNGLDNASGAHE